ncbi:MAG: selenium cofactor biosynthesis protein YqeC [Bacillota bacterium]
MKLIDAFGIDRGDVVALVGAGGKTATMFALGEEAVEKGFRVVLTTTTRIYFPGAGIGRPVVLAGGPEILVKVREVMEGSPLVVAGAGTDGDNKMTGVEKGLAGRFLEAGADLVVAEADGSAGRPFKAPREGEPVIPEAATLVVPVVGIDCLGRPLSAGYVHRPEMVARLTGLRPGEVIAPRIVAGVLTHAAGYRKDVPAGSRWVPFINKVESAKDLRLARELAELLGRGGAGKVVIGSALRAGPAREVLVF